MIYFQRRPQARPAPHRNPVDRAQFVDNPPWVARTIAVNFKTLQQAASKPGWMPTIVPKRSTGRGNQITADISQYGCGAYGCVMPTSDPGVVFKVTRDPTEAEFIREVIPRIAPPGITGYFGVVDLKSTQKHPAWGLWREAAEKVGELTPAGKALLNSSHGPANEAFQILNDASDPTDLFLAAMDAATEDDAAAELRELLTEFVGICQKMAADRELRWVGSALLEFLANGIFVADVHAGNVGTVTRDGQEMVVITDPGHAAVLPEPWPVGDNLHVNPARCRC